MPNNNKKELDLNEIPANLSEESCRIWEKVRAEVEFFDITLYSYLKCALENLDLANKMTEQIIKDGFVIENKRSKAKKIHPLLSARDKCLTQYLKAWNLCGLDLEPPSSPGRR